MPTYQYACTACGENIEVVQSFTDPALTECNACGGSLRKVFSAVGVVFKGSGFYKTDSRPSSSEKKAEPAAKSDATTKATETSPAATGESKPAAKSANKPVTSTPAA